MHRDQRANLARHLGTCFRRRLHGADVAVDDDRDEPVAYFLAADDRHVGGLDHGIRSSQCCDIALGLDHSDGIAHGILR